MCNHITHIFLCQHTQKFRVKCSNRRTRRCMPCQHEVHMKSLCRECFNVERPFEQEILRRRYESWSQRLVKDSWYEFVSRQFPELRIMEHSAFRPNHPSMRRVRGSANLAQEYQAGNIEKPTPSPAAIHPALLGTQAFPAELAANGENDLVKGGPLGHESNPAELPAPSHGPVRSARRRDSFSLDSITSALSRLTHPRPRRNA